MRFDPSETAEGWVVGEIQEYPAARSDEEREAFVQMAIQECHGLRSERAYVLEEDGRAWSVNGLDDSVPLPPSLSGRCTIIHPHPGATPPSGRDLIALKEAVGRKMVVVLPDQVYYLENLRLVGSIDEATTLRRAQLRVVNLKNRLGRPASHSELAWEYWNALKPLLGEIGIELVEYRYEDDDR